MTKIEVELMVEPGYLFSQVGPNHWKVLKVDPTTTPISILARHEVKQGTCDCEGFKHHLKCRHVAVVQANPPLSNRAHARHAVADILESWQEIANFSRLVFDEYEFADAEEEQIRSVRITAHGTPIMVDGVQHSRITGVTKSGVHVIVRIVP
jgi:hypothetical protein